MGSGGIARRLQFLVVLAGLMTVEKAKGVEQHKPIVNPHPFTFHLNNEKLCDVDSDVLIWIHSAPNHFRDRQIIRETWGNPGNFHLHKAALVFFLGISTSPPVQQMIEYESEVYNDIVQSTFIDHYHNLTYKAISGSRWMSLYCNRINLVLKADDDMMVDVYLLFNHIHSLQQNGRLRTNTILCDVWMNRWPDRNPGKWRVSNEEYAANYYPTYCPGLGLVMTGDLPPRLFAASLYEKYFWIDDVYITGLLARTVNATFERLGAGVHFGSARKIKMQMLAENPYQWVFYHVHERPSMLTIWETIEARQKDRLETGASSFT